MGYSSRVMILIMIQRGIVLQHDQTLVLFLTCELQASLT